MNSQQLGERLHAYTTLGDDLIVMVQRLARGEDVPHVERVDLARRKLAIFEEIQGEWGGVEAADVTRARTELAALEAEEAGR